MARKPGRPRIPAKDRKQPVSVSLLPADIRKLDEWCNRHGVSRSQLMYDAIRSMDGSIQQDLAHLRNELADQRAVSERMEHMTNKMREELSRLQSSQDLADAIVNPYQSPDAKLSKQEKERSRTMRTMLINPDNYHNLRLLAHGELDKAPLPVFADLLRAWGSWSAAWEAAQAAQEAKNA